VRFNPPPNWPALPAGFTPPAGWQPDPKWGGVPYGWPLWIDNDASRVAPSFNATAWPDDTIAAPPPLLTPVPPEVPKPWLVRHWVSLAVIVVLIVGAVVAYKVHMHQQKLAGHQVVYSVTTSGGATVFDIDYATAGGSQQATNVTTPWTYSAQLRAIGSTAALYLSAQNGSDGNVGSVTCTITVDGTVAASNTSSGAASIATCEALIH